jgi:sulfopyruvate decarboxylase subunit beta
MTQQEALEILAAHRGSHVVVTTMSAVAIWPALSDGPLDFSHIPSSMGQAPALGLGLALARRKLASDSGSSPGGVIVVNGEGSMLMNLGNLVTLAHNPADVYLIVMDNGLYEVTGGQSTAGTGHANFATLAQGAGIHRVYTFADPESWRQGAAEALSGPGPVVIWLQVEGRLGQKTPKPPRPMSEQVARLRQGLGVGVGG